MTYSTAVSSPIAHRTDGNRFVAQPCVPAKERSKGSWWEICERPEQDICLEDGEFQLSGPYGSRRIARFTGRRRWVDSSTYAPTVEVYDVDTVVMMVGDLPVIVGKRGERFKGTWWVHPSSVNYDVVSLVG